MSASDHLAVTIAPFSALNVAEFGTVTHAGVRAPALAETGRVIPGVCSPVLPTTGPALTSTGPPHRRQPVPAQLHAARQSPDQPTSSLLPENQTDAVPRTYPSSSPRPRLASRPPRVSDPSVIPSVRRPTSTSGPTSRSTDISGELPRPGWALLGAASSDQLVWTGGGAESVRDRRAALIPLASSWSSCVGGWQKRAAGRPRRKHAGCRPGSELATAEGRCPVPGVRGSFGSMVNLWLGLRVMPASQVRPAWRSRAGSARDEYRRSPGVAPGIGDGVLASSACARVVGAGSGAG